MSRYEIYKQIGGRRIYVAVDMDISVSNTDAISIADGYFKAGKNNLSCTTGRVIDKDLYLDESKGKYPKTLNVEHRDVWVVSRK